eukprot:1817764-Pyramimonas_sp.AAC.1
MQCEKALVWPTRRLVSRLVRLPKPDGGHRLIAILDTILRVWGRIRRSVSDDWEAGSRTREFWGSGEGRSSSDSAFDLNLYAEVARARGWHSVTLLLDM